MADADDDGDVQEQTMVRILLADDHTLVRQGIRRILEEQPDWQVVGGNRRRARAVRLTPRNFSRTSSFSTSACRS